jgi:biopolymer transport protein ExbD
MRVALAGRVAIVLIIAGGVLLAYSICCLAPHPRVALDIPVSLSPGHVSTADFTVEADTLYYVDVVVGPIAHTPVDCRPYSVLGTQWTLRSGGQVVERGSSPWEDSGLTIAAILGENGRYAFDMTVLPGASCLNARNPRLRVRTHVHPSDLYSSLNWLSIWMIATGLVLLIRLWAARVFEVQPMSRIFPGMALRNVVRLQRHSSMPLNQLPNYGASWVWSCVLLIVMIFGMAAAHRREYGLMVSLKEGDSPVWQRNAWPQTLSVYVDGQDRFYLNGRPVPPEDLRVKLNSELEKRVNWTVYFEGDDNCSYGAAVFAIDTIQGLGAKLIWITPRVRGQLSKDSMR